MFFWGDTVHPCFLSFAFDQMSWSLGDSGINKAWKRGTQSNRQSLGGTLMGERLWLGVGKPRTRFFFMLRTYLRPRDQLLHSTGAWSPWWHPSSKRKRLFTPISDLPVTWLRCTLMIVLHVLGPGTPRSQKESFYPHSEHTACLYCIHLQVFTLNEFVFLLTETIDTYFRELENKYKIKHHITVKANFNYILSRQVKALSLNSFVFIFSTLITPQTALILCFVSFYSLKNQNAAVCISKHFISGI